MVQLFFKTYLWFAGSDDDDMARPRCCDKTHPSEVRSKEVKTSKLLEKTTGHNISKNDTAEGMCFVYFMLTMLVLKCGDVGYGCIATHV